MAEQHLAVRPASASGEPSPEARIARLLLTLIEGRLGHRPLMAGMSFDLPIRVDKLAQATALSVESVCQILADFPRQNVLGYRWQSVIVHDPRALLAAASPTGKRWPSSPAEWRDATA